MRNFFDAEIVEADIEVETLSELSESEFPESDNSHNQLNSLSTDILLVTSEIQSKYPELYKHLEETPFAVNGHSETNITLNELQNYRETLINQLVNHFETHDLDASNFDLYFSPQK